MEDAGSDQSNVVNGPAKMFYCLYSEQFEFYHSILRKFAIMIFLAIQNKNIEHFIDAFSLQAVINDRLPNLNRDSKAASSSASIIVQ